MSLDVQQVMERMHKIMQHLTLTPPQWRGHRIDLMIDEWIQLKREVYGDGEDMPEVPERGKA